MAETQLKRQREDEVYDVQSYECEEDTKRHKSYNDILSILEQEEDEPNQDLSDIFTSLQQELSSDSTTLNDPSSGGGSGGSDAESAHQTGGSGGSECSPSSNNEEEEDERVRVMRHLLEASDDELGIPNRVESGDEETNSGEQLFSLGEGMWEFEDDAANYYYTLMQSELFM